MGGLNSGRATRSFLLRAENGLFTGNTYGTYLNVLEQGGENGLRYISPVFGGFNFGASIHGDDKWGAGVNYGATHGTISVGFGAGIGEDSRIDGVLNGGDVVNDKITWTGISGGIKESGSGLFLQGTWTRKDFSDVALLDATNLYVAGGWAKNVTGHGDTTIFVSHNRTNDLASRTATSAASTLAIGLNQKFNSAATNLFLTYENSSIDTAIGDDELQSISAITAGMSIQY